MKMMLKFSISHIFNRVFFNVQFYTKCAVLNQFVQLLKNICAVRNNTTFQSKNQSIKGRCQLMQYTHSFNTKAVPGYFCPSRNNESNKYGVVNVDDSI